MWTTTWMDKIKHFDAQARHADGVWRDHVAFLDSDDMADLAQNRRQPKSGACRPPSGIEAQDMLAYLAKHLDAAELTALKARAAGEPTDKRTLKSARRKARHAMLVMK